MSKQRIIIDTPLLSADGFKSVCDLAPGQQVAVQNLSALMASIPDQVSAELSVLVGAVQASGTITVSSTGSVAAQTMTICGVTFTAVASGATGNQFNVSATPATQASNMASAINAASSLSGIVTASSLGAVVTVQAVVPGKIGNGLVMANVNLANVVVVSLAAGSDGTSYSLDLR